ncbi:glycosyl transferase family 2 [Flavobacterium cyanobacteriorum]|uniref:Glycosyl transferase family 2 n=1 Tax=Flavobacterium cyanobacteriorum TaxID=2022802 RepID=A0A255Z1Z9_9FLAO|nr:glycosyltransferase family 2 protein [Flavobacterium cyanobacteriorum]OYQ34670.1 glycosyl transferase family 2 [Flavobacterium cyanobacteriorum]
MTGTSSRPKISALAITFNEEDNIKRYVQSLSFADEIIIVDSLSTDKTTEIARELGVKVITKAFLNFSEQRNFALQQASHDWILFFDLDEVVTPELEHEINKVLAADEGVIAYHVKRKFHFMGRHIRFGGWQTDRVVRLFNKNFCSYSGLVHEKLNTNGPVGILKEKVNHYSYKSFDNYNGKLTLYSKLQAESLYNKKKRPNAYHFFFRPFYRFCWQYFYRLGILDGKEGFILAYVHAFSVFKRYLQLWMKYRKIA